MHLEPNDNLAVSSIRHDLYGPGRFHPIHHHHHHNDHVHEDHKDTSRVHRQPDVVRVVQQSQRPKPADFQPCQCGGETRLNVYPPDKAYPAAIPIPEIDIVTIPADIAPPSEKGALQGYIYGQAVPANGNLLDVMA
jgi:hypothetical protein